MRFSTNVYSGHNQTDDTGFLTVTLPSCVQAEMQEIVATIQADLNPYHASEADAEGLCATLRDVLIRNRKGSAQADIDPLLKTIELAEQGSSVPAILIRNGVADPSNSLLAASSSRGYAYASCATDRMKMGFFAEWYSWAIAKYLGTETLFIRLSTEGTTGFTSYLQFRLVMQAYGMFRQAPAGVNFRFTTTLLCRGLIPPLMT